MRSIAADPGCSHTTAPRGVARASAGGRYGFRSTQHRMEREARRPSPAKLEADAVLRTHVAVGLNRTWSPRQISERMSADFPDKGFSSEATGIEVYFCSPHCPRQKRISDNTNGLIREFFPKVTDFADVTDGEMARVQNLLNARPREAPEWKTPAEAVAEVPSGTS